ncbi:MAG: formylglycine-generating enzyme family protein [Actinomycetota bacterium]|nr:formylglycine-generating enzyme family protein [Actinomycetota bacterium]
MTHPDLLVPRPLDEPTLLPLPGDLDLDLDVEAADRAKIFAAPESPDDWPRWRERLSEWRHAAWQRWPHDGAAYDRQSARWTQSCFTVALVWLWDERLFDHTTQRFTAAEFIEATAGFGGFDAIVLWQAYPIIGIDERTQFDFYRHVPGVPELIQTFRDRGIAVFVDYNPWDTATGDAAEHPELVAGLVEEFGIDGVFLDTLSESGAALRDTLTTLPTPPVLEGESRVSLERIADHQLSWAQWFADTEAPGVLRARWFERRHMLHHTRRWNRDHSDELQSSWMNGTGIMVWDAVFGSWVGWNERDRSTLRAMVRVQRVLADVLVSGDWTPLVDATSDALSAGVFVSRYRHGDVTLWTVVNRGTTDYRGAVLDNVPDTGGSWFEVTTGARMESGHASVVVPARGVAGIVTIPDEISEEFAAMVDAAAADRHIADATFPARDATRHEAPTSSSAPPPSAIRVSAGERQLTITYRLRETGMYDGAPFVEAWKPLPPLLHSEVTESRVVTLGPVAVASAEVTNGEFAEFAATTGYRPDVPHRYALHWPTGDGAAAGAERDPMTHVNLADARAFAAWVGARLPTEFEWQVAADDPGFTRVEPLVWNLTESEHSDGITRFVMLKGGSAYEATESEWYFDGGRRPPSFCAKLLLAGLGVERSARIGFRVAWDTGDEIEEAT